ncbi:hypothetical protein HWV62_32754 [Athelia sp. TMB]|nr:hypothetical protein HWV62_32754 [Athelia sp. TMB]
MHGSIADHRDILKRQGLLGGILGGGDSSSTATASTTDLLGSIIGGFTSALLPTPSDSSPTSTPTVSLTSPSSSSSSSSTVSSSSSTSVSSSSSSSTTSSSSSSIISPTSSSSSVLPPSTSVTPPAVVPSPTSTPPSTSTITGVATTVTATVSPSASASPVSGASQSFLQNKPLSSGVFAAVGIIGAIILALICVVWVRSARRRTLDREAVDFDPGLHTRFTDGPEDEEKRSTEALNLRRAASSGSGHSQARYAAGGYPVPPMPVRAADYAASGYGGTYAQQVPFPAGQPGYAPQQQQYQQQNMGYAPPRSPQPGYVPPRSPQPPPSPNPVYTLEGQQNPALPPAAAVRSSPPSSSDHSQRAGRRLSSHSRTLDPQMGELPASPPLPDHFGSDEDAYNGIASTLAYEPAPAALKIANA